MVWFRVDDGWHKHRKRIRVGLDMEGFAARGLWVDAGSWSSDELADGFIPDDVVDYLAPGIGQLLAKRLEYARLWERCERDGETGWQFHQWDEQQPTREEVEAALSKKSTGGKLGNHRRWHTGKGKEDPSCPYCDSERKPRKRSSAPIAEASRTTDRTTDRSTESGANPPTRPDPTRPDHPEDPDQPSVDLFGAAAPSTQKAAVKPAKRTAKVATRIPDDFTVTDAMSTWAAEKTPSVDWPSETDNFIDYWTARAKDDTKKDWEAAWRTWMRNAQKDLERRGINRRWQPGTSNRGRAGCALTRRDSPPDQHRPSTSAARARQALSVAARLDAKYANGATA